MNNFSAENLQQAISQVNHWRREGRRDLAEQQIQEILQSRPGEVNATFLLGVLRREEGRFAEAIDILAPITVSNPGFAGAQLELASAHRGAGDLNAAIATLRTLIERAPGHAMALRRLGDTLIQSGEIRQGRQVFAQAAQTDPFRAELAKAITAQNERDFSTAETILRSVLERDPEHVYAIIGLSTLASVSGQLDKADALLDIAANLTPNLDTVWVHKARLGFEQNNFERAEAAATRTVELAHDVAAYWHLLGDIQANGFSPEKAPQSYLKALELSPYQAYLHLALGHAYKALGKRAESEKAYRDALEQNPNLGEAYWALADLKTAQFSASDFHNIEAALNSGLTPGPDHACLLFAHAKALEDQGQKPEAFEQYLKANAMQAQIAPFNAEGFEQMVGETRSVPPMARQDTTEASTATPIFIVGLPRSGSTLVEQILASHSQVEGTMELGHIPGYAREISMKHGSYGAALSSESDEALLQIGQRYLDETTGFRTGRPFFIDKLPNNYLHIPLISRALPHAIIIDVRRNPLDCGVSCFRQYFSKGQAFSYSLETIGRYYKSYVDLMAFWADLAPGRVHCVVYEDLVQSPDSTIKGLLDACGLKFEAACLNFHENNRVVRTASSEQVRQPLSSSGIGRWREYAEFLDPLKQALGPELTALST